MLRKSVLEEGKEKPRAKAPEERHACFILGTGDPVVERKGYRGGGVRNCSGRDQRETHGPDQVGSFNPFKSLVFTLVRWKVIKEFE